LSSAVRVMGEIKEEQNEMREREGVEDASWKAVPREREGRTKE
jgi:hypothetical protein